MDYYQGVVVDYLRADRAMFVNTEHLIQLDDGLNQEKKGRHWYCDVMAVNFREHTIYLGEITYSKTLSALLKRLSAWSENWEELRQALIRDASLPTDWSVIPWAFVPGNLIELLRVRLAERGLDGVVSGGMPCPMITALEDTSPWKYNPHARFP